MIKLSHGRTTSVWPTSNGHIEGIIVNDAGAVTRKRVFKWKHWKGWWHARGFSFNGKIKSGLRAKPVVLT